MTTSSAAATNGYSSTGAVPLEGEEGLRADGVLVDYLLEVASLNGFDLAEALPTARMWICEPNPQASRAQRQAANESDIQEMATLARRAIEAGALGFTTSRTILHKSSLGEPTPTLNAEFDELVAIAEAIGSTGKGVLQLISDFGDFGDEFHLAHEMARRSGRPISISVAQTRADKDRWRLMLDKMHDATSKGVTMRGQVGARPVGVLMGHLGTLNPFMHCPTYVELRKLPFAEMIAELRRPDTRQRILAEDPIDRSSPRVGSRLVARFSNMYPLADPPNYEPAPDQALTRLAEKRHITAAELAYDLMLADNGTAMIYLPTANYVDENLDHLR